MRYLEASLVNFVVVIFIHFLFMGCLPAGDQPHANCSIGVFDEGVTSDGRPILRKNRDIANLKQRLVYVKSCRRDGILTIPYIGNAYSSDSSRVYVGAGLKGFAIISSDIPPENRFPVSIRTNDSPGGDVKSFAGTEFAENSVIWNGDDSKGDRVKSGVYFYSLRAGPIRLSNKTTLVK